MPRTFLAFAALLLSQAASAQNSAPANVVTPAPAPREGTVGPEQLRDFTLPGTRTPAPATQEPAPTPPPATRKERPAAPSTSQAAPPRAPVAAPAQGGSAEQRAAPSVSSAPASSAPAVGTAAENAPAAPEPAFTTPLPAPAFDEPPLTASPTENLSDGAGWLSWWPWLLVAALAGIGLALLLRRRRQPVLAGADGEMAYDAPAEPAPVATPLPRAAPAPAPAPEPKPASPLPSGMVTTRLRSPAPKPLVERVPAEAALSPSPSPAPTGGVVSRRLRGWIDLDLAMREILFVEDEALIRFDLTIANGGAAPARQIVIEALPLNASDTQAEEIGRFFNRAAANESGLPEIGPLGSVTISHEIRMPRSAIRAYEAQGRTLFVPVIAFNASYRTASGEGRTSAAFLVGREMAGSERLAPLKLEPGAARLLGLGVRRLEEAVRR